MKKIITSYVALLITAIVFLPQQVNAQAPEKMSYQAVVRDGSNDLVTEAQVGMKISILQGTASGTAVYVETQTPTSNANGLVSLEIGTGVTISGDFTTIVWANGPYFIKTETDPTGGTNYTITGTSQLLSVPYALYAQTSGSSIPGPQGPQGIQGEQGPIGPTGATGPQGIQGPPGNDGVDGLNGTDGVDGQDGVGIASTVDNSDGTFTINYTDGSSFTTADLTGPQGAQGIQGEQGPIGPTGATGPQGVQGPPGNDGVDGLNGTDGADGQDGVGIASTVDNNDGTFTINYTDGSSFTTADLTGPQGIASPGENPGDMLYWNGTAWITIAATENEGATLQMIGGVPTWTGGTPPIPNVTNPTTGQIWMDRNLGASQVATSSNNAAAYGDLYQWGRAADGHQIRTSGTTTTLATNDTPGHGDFITNGSSPYDWRNPQNDNLWQGVNGTNNPCPSGYRLPTEAEWEAERTSWSSNNSAGAFGSPLKLPVAGYRNRSNGSLSSVGSGGGYWSSTVGGTHSRYLYFYSSNAFMLSINRAYGYSVRCLKD